MADSTPPDRQATIAIPGWEYGDLDAVQKWLGLRESALKQLIKDGVFPPGEVINRANVVWHWKTVVAASWLLPHLLRMRPGGAETGES